MVGEPLHHRITSTGWRARSCQSIRDRRSAHFTVHLTGRELEGLRAALRHDGQTICLNRQAIRIGNTEPA
jgi:hypothetical protein